MLNEVKHLYNKDSSLTLRMTVSVIIYIVTKNDFRASTKLNFYKSLVCMLAQYEKNMEDLVKEQMMSKGYAVDFLYLCTSYKL